MSTPLIQIFQTHLISSSTSTLRRLRRTPSPTIIRIHNPGRDMTKVLGLQGSWVGCTTHVYSRVIYELGSVMVSLTQGVWKS